VPNQESGDEPEMNENAAIEGLYSKVSNPKALHLEYETVNRKPHAQNPIP